MFSLYSRVLSSLGFCFAPGSQRPVVVVIHPWKLAYFRIPKAANSSIKHVFARALDLAKQEGVSQTSDRYWLSQDPDVVEILSVKEFVQRGYEHRYFSFSVVRDPVDRVFSCYRNKFLRNAELSDSLASRGFTQSMDFADFVDHLCTISDRDADVHLMPQSYILSYKRRVRAKTIITLPELAQRWRIIQDYVRDNSGVRLDDLPIINSTDSVDGEISHNSKVIDKLKRRYRRDYALLPFERR